MNKIIQEGLRPHIETGKELRTGFILRFPKLEELPKEFIIQPLTIKNQIADGNDDFCASCATTGAIEPREEVELYYPFLFAAAKAVTGEDPDSWGLPLDSIGKAVVKYGIPELKDIPKEVLDLTPEQRRRLENYPKSVRDSAYKHRAKSYLYITGPYDHYDNARALLWYFRNEKRNFVFGVNFGWNLDEEVLDGTPDGYGHALYSGGWNDENIGRAVNSAGLEAGKNGVHGITRETFNYFAKKYNMIMFVDFPREMVEDYIRNDIKVGDGWFKRFLKRIFA